MATLSSHEGLNTSYFDHFTCNICLEVLREPVQCARNEHYFCKSCITQHLTRSQTCPVCQDRLTTTTLRPASRVVANLLQQFQSPRCRYANRGCTASVRHEVLLTHHEECGFAPVQCSHDGCEDTVNRQDLESHERAKCDFRPVTCEECKQKMRQREHVKHPCVFLKEIDDNKLGLVEVQKILREIKEEQRQQGVEIQRHAAEIKQLMTITVGQQQQREEIEQQTKEASQQREDVQGLASKLILSNSTKRQQSGSLRQQQLSATIKEQKSDGALISRHLSSGAENEEKQILVAKGKSCEVFNWSTQKWSSYKNILFFDHQNGFSFVYDNKVVLCGGNYTTRIECLNISSDISSNALPSLLPKYCGKGALYGDTIVTVGEFLSETSLKPPYNTNTVCPVISKQELSACEIYLEKGEKAYLCSHGVAYVENHGVVIVGGLLKTSPRDNLRRRRDEVLLYNPTTKKLHKLAPLPYEVADMAVLAYDGNVMILGGEKLYDQISNDVLMYNLTSQQCSMLPKMSEARSKFAAVMSGHTIVVMGGTSWEFDNRGRKTYKTLKTAEYLVLGEKAWKKLPSMQPTCDATACVVP